jgi:hypothetical protein
MNKTIFGLIVEPEYDPVVFAVTEREERRVPAYIRTAPHCRLK